MPWSGVQLMFLERVNFTLMGMVIDWGILMILLDQVVVKGRSLLNRWSVIIRELLLRSPWLLNLQLRPLLRALGFQQKRNRICIWNVYRDWKGCRVLWNRIRACPGRDPKPSPIGGPFLFHIQLELEFEQQEERRSLQARPLSHEKIRRLNRKDQRKPDMCQGLTEKKAQEPSNKPFGLIKKAFKKAFWGFACHLCFSFASFSFQLVSA